MIKFKGFFKTPYFYYIFALLILLGLVQFGIFPFSDSPKAEVAFFVSDLNKANYSHDETSFFNQHQIPVLELPELKIIQNESLAAISSPRVLSLKVLGAVFGQEAMPRKEIIEYEVQAGDTLQSIADNFEISLNTLLFANNLTKSSKIKVGQKLVILPVSGLVHFVKSGDTLSEIAQKYKAKIEEIMEWNEMADESEIYVGDILIIPNGVAPEKPVLPVQTKLADSFFVFPTEGKISQTLHWYNGVDIANKCGTPVVAAAPGEVLKANYGWNNGGGNVITIKHQEEVVTYYGHLMTILVKAGDRVDYGEIIGLMGGQPGMPGAGISTGCHLHFSVINAKNPFANYPLWYEMKWK